MYYYDCKKSNPLVFQQLADFKKTGAVLASASASIFEASAVWTSGTGGTAGTGGVVETSGGSVVWISGTAGTSETEGVVATAVATVTAEDTKNVAATKAAGAAGTTKSGSKAAPGSFSQSGAPVNHASIVVGLAVVFASAFVISF